MSKLIMLDGELVSAREYCRRKGIKYTSVRNRAQRNNETYEEALAYCENNPSCCYNVNDVVVLSDDDMNKLIQFAKANNIRENTMRTFVKNNPYMDLNDIIEFYKNRHSTMNTIIEFNGKIASVEEHCKDIGISRTTLYDYIGRTGKSIEEVLLFYLNNGGKYKFKIDGKLVPMTKYCEYMGYDYEIIANYKYNHKVTWEEAIQYYLKFEPKRKVKDRRLYYIWHGMMERCYNPKNIAYKNYGKKGIKVQDSWHDYFNFEDDMYNEYIKHVEEFGEKDTSIDRYPIKTGNYEINNVRWATIKEQNNNTSRNLLIDDLTLAQICDEHNLPYDMSWKRLQRGWTIEEIINTPNKKKTITTPTGESVPQLAKKLGIPKHVIYGRLKAGWTWDEIINTPLQVQFSHKKHKE